VESPPGALEEPPDGEELGEPEKLGAQEPFGELDHDRLMAAAALGVPGVGEVRAQEDEVPLPVVGHVVPHETPPAARDDPGELDLRMEVPGELEAAVATALPEERGGRGRGDPFDAGKHGTIQ
jgi:hypothetical protein